MRALVDGMRADWAISIRRACGALRFERSVALHSVAVDDDHFARIDFAHELGADDIERTGLGGQRPTVAEASKKSDLERPSLSNDKFQPRVADGNQATLREIKEDFKNASATAPYTHFPS